MSVNNYNNREYPADAVSENAPRRPVLFVCNRSNGMAEAITALNGSVNSFRSCARSFEATGRCVDAAVISFNHEINVEQDWRPVSQMEPVNFKAEGGTDLSSALEMGVRMLDDRCRYYKDNRIDGCKPCLILITGGCGGDITEIAETIRQRTADGTMELLVLAVRGCDQTAIAQLGWRNRVFELDNEYGFDFSAYYLFPAAFVKPDCATPMCDPVRMAKILKRPRQLRLPDDWADLPERNKTGVGETSRSENGTSTRKNRIGISFDLSEFHVVKSAPDEPGVPVLFAIDCDNPAMYSSIRAKLNCFADSILLDTRMKEAECLDPTKFFAYSDAGKRAVPTALRRESREWGLRPGRLTVPLSRPCRVRKIK